MALACLSNECWSYIYLPYRVVQRLTGSTATGHLFAAELVCISMLLSIFRIVRHQCLFLLLVVEVSRFTAYATPLRLRQLDTQSRYVSAGSGPAEAHRQSSGIQLEMQELWRASNAASKHTNLAQLSHALNSGQPCQQTLDKYFVPSGAQLLDQARISACTHLAAASLTDGYGAQLKRRLGER